MGSYGIYQFSDIKKINVPNYNVGSRSTKRTDTVKKKQGLGAVYMKEDRSTRKILEGG